MAPTLLVAGTASHVGKSTVAAGLCRALSERGLDVAPFKAQNMSNNARAVPRPPAVRDGSDAPAARDDDVASDAGSDDGDPNDDGPDGRDDAIDDGDDGIDGDARLADPAFGEVGVSQYVQARAAGVRPTTDHNPVLLKPRGEGESQLVIDGRAVGHYGAGEYYEDHWERARGAAREAHARLAADHDLVIAEGAGSVAEINLHDRDLANVETARFADAAILLVGDIERGGVFASLVGSLELMPDDLRGRVVGAAITKFRGDRSILDPGLEAFEERTGVPVLGVLPYDDPGLPEEDSVALPAADERAVRGEDGVPDDEATTVAVVRLPRVSNATDVEPLAREPGVRVAYRPPDADYGDADAVVLPGTKNGVDDLLACRAAGLGDELRSFDGPVVGLCGGYQLLGERILNADVESARDDPAAAVDDSPAGSTDGATVPGFGLLPVETVFSRRKRVRPATVECSGAGPLAGATGRLSGYEIHMGETRPTGETRTGNGGERAEGATGQAGTDVTSNEGEASDRAAVTYPFRDGDRDGAGLGIATGDVLGTYLHGLFENRSARRAFLRAAGWAPPDDDGTADPYAAAGRLVADGLAVGELLAATGVDDGG